MFSMWLRRGLEGLGDLIGPAVIWGLHWRVLPLPATPLAARGGKQVHGAFVNKSGASGAQCAPGSTSGFYVLPSVPTGLTQKTPSE